jgi:magnesium transporter
MTQQPDSQVTLGEKIADATRRQLAAYVDGLSPLDAAHSIARLSEDEQSQLFTRLPTRAAAHLLDELPDVQAAEIIEHLSASDAAAIVVKLPSDEQADLLHDLSPDTAEAIISELSDDAARQVRELSKYADNVAGGLMVTEFLAYSENNTVSDVINDLREHVERYRHYEVQYAYVTGSDNELKGVLQLRDLLLTPHEKPIHELMIRRPMNIGDQTELEDLRDFFYSHPYFAVPITDSDNRLVGIVRRSDVEEALGDKSESDFRRSQGILQEELRTMPVLTRARRRLAWLSVNILLNIIAASVIAFYQETLAKVIALAVFIPIISDMSGCSGNQAVAVSMRELSLGVVKTTEIFRVWLKEVTVGLINGLALGGLVAAVAILWQGNPYLGLVVGVAMMVNTLVAVSLGGALPLILKRLNIDPALASGPILTTVTDMCGFFLILSIATSMIRHLT